MRPEDKLQGQTIQAAGPAVDTVREQDKIQLVLAYLWPLGLVPMLTVKDSEYVQWHAKNGLVIFLAALAISIVSSVLSFTCIVPVIGMIASLGLLVIDLMAMMKSLKGERWRIPVLTDLAEKF